jgi:hypothetical protein
VPAPVIISDSITGQLLAVDGGYLAQGLPG